MVTTSWFNPKWIEGQFNGFGEWMNDFIINVITNKKYVDILSPQLYAVDCHDKVWDGVLGWSDSSHNLTQEAKKSLIDTDTIMAPSINYNPSEWGVVRDTWKVIFGKYPSGYFQFCDKYNGGNTQGC